MAVAKKTLIEEFQNPKSKRKKVRRRYAIALHERPANALQENSTNFDGYEPDMS